MRAVGGVAATAVIAAAAVGESYANGGSTLRCHKVGAGHAKASAKCAGRPSGAQLALPGQLAAQNVLQFQGFCRYQPVMQLEPGSPACS